VSETLDAATAVTPIVLTNWRRLTADNSPSAQSGQFSNGRIVLSFSRTVEPTLAPQKITERPRHGSSMPVSARKTQLHSASRCVLTRNARTR
jgi:hypothetical protein